MVRFSGKGSAAAKFAAFLNSIVSFLSKYIIAGRGIQVLASSGLKGVTISTNALLTQKFRITGSEHGVGGYYTTRIGKVAQITDGPPATGPIGPNSDAVEHDLYFNHTSGWHPRGSTVLCADIMGQWEVISQGHHYLEAMLLEDADAIGSFDVSPTQGPYAAGLSIDQQQFYFRWFTALEGDVVGAVWDDLMNRWNAIAKDCAGDVNGGGAAAPMDALDGGDANGYGDGIDGGSA